MRTLKRGIEMYPAAGETVCERCKTHFEWEREDLAIPLRVTQGYRIHCPECDWPHYVAPLPPLKTTQ